MARRCAENDACEVRLSRRVFQAILLILLSWVCTTAQEQRFYRVDDDLEIERVDDVIFSPDGRALAFSRGRPRKTALGAPDSSFLIRQTRSDVWLQDAPGAPPRNLTNGLSDQSGAWGPQWSPDGQRLAFYSSRGGSVKVWAWDRATNRVEPLSPQAVELYRPCQWMDASRLLCLGLSSGAIRQPLSPEGEVAASAQSAWEKARRGELTASVLDSTEFKPVTRHLYLIDAVRKTTRAIAPALEATSRAGSWWLAPDGRVVAVAAPIVSRYGMVSLLRLGHPRKVELHVIDGDEIRLKQALPAQVLTSTLRWSPDGQELAFFAYDDRPVNPLVLYGAQSAEVMPEYLTSPKLPLENPARLYRVNIQHGTVEQIPTGDIDLGWLSAPVFMWTRDGELVFNAPRQVFGATTWNNVPRRGAGAPQALGPSPDKIWWVLNREGRTRPLSSQLSAMPDMLETPDDGGTFLGVNDGDALRINPRTGDVTNLTSLFEPSVTGMMFVMDQKPMTHLVIQTRAVGERRGTLPLLDSFMLDLASSKTVIIAKPEVSSDLLAVSSTAQQVVYKGDGPKGLFLWRGPPTGPLAALVEANTYRQGIKPCERRIVEFTSLQGEKLKAALLLPPDYVAGRRYPMIVEAYSGRTEGNIRNAGAIAFGYQAYNETFGASGYALLIPEIPKNVKGLDAIDEGNSPLSVVSAVLPAVEQMVRSGIADQDRLFLYGFSFGGWTVASALAQTTRFKAAVGVSGSYYDDQLFGNVGSMARGLMRRYQETPHEWISTSANNKVYYPTDVPWWRDLTRIHRNSPLSYVDRIQTPLLVLHGDLDGAAYVEQSESMFNALASMRKRAQFVRYWGEGHELKIQANRRDSWQRILAWYDEFGDVLRDSSGKMVFEGDRVKSRSGGPALKPADFARFGPAAPAREEIATHTDGKREH